MELDNNFLNDYFTKYETAVKTADIKQKITDLAKAMKACANRGGKIIFAGNGASSAIASHCALDFTKQGNIRSMCFDSSAFLTAFVNDYGYDLWLSEAMKCYADKDDLVVLISSSGKSSNIVKAAYTCKFKGVQVATCTGFSEGNPLKSVGDINLWVDSKAYNIIECTHQFWLMAACDLLIGKAEYSVS